MTENNSLAGPAGDGPKNPEVKTEDSSLLPRPSLSNNHTSQNASENTLGPAAQIRTAPNSAPNSTNSNTSSASNTTTTTSQPVSAPPNAPLNAPPSAPPSAPLDKKPKKEKPTSEQENGKKPRRKKVNRACVYCRRSHMNCDSNRPCLRCVKRNIGHLCHDSPTTSKRKEDIKPSLNQITTAQRLQDSHMPNRPGLPPLPNPPLIQRDPSGPGQQGMALPLHMGPQMPQMPQMQQMQQMPQMPQPPGLQGPPGAQQMSQQMSQMSQMQAMGQMPPMPSMGQMPPGPPMPQMQPIQPMPQQRPGGPNNLNNPNNPNNGNIPNNPNNPNPNHPNNLNNPNNPNNPNNLNNPNNPNNPNSGQMPNQMVAPNGETQMLQESGQDMFQLQNPGGPEAQMALHNGNGNKNSESATRNGSANSLSNLAFERDHLGGQSVLLQTLSLNQNPFFVSEHANSEFSSLNEFLSMINEPNDLDVMDFPPNQQNSGKPSVASSPFGNNLPTMGPQAPQASNAPVISDSARDKFFLTAADPSTEISPEERLKQVINAKLEAGLLQPYNYAKGYARLQVYMDNYMNHSSRQRILKPLSIFRPAFRAIARTLKDVDLILVEEAFERMLLDYDRVFTSMAIPACLWRRTGEIYRGNKEFAGLVEVSVDDLRDGKLAIYELMSEESAVNYWEKYGDIAFDSAQKAVLTSCNLRTRDGRKRRACCFSFTIRRDRYNM